jgi:hypothetical protein
VSWLRLDDKFAEHPKFAGWTPREKWAWLSVMSYCARYRTGGIIPDDLRLLPKDCDKKLVEKARESGWLETNPDTGVETIHDWDFYNPSDATQATRQARFRQKRNGPRNAPRNGESNAPHARAGAPAAPYPSLERDSLSQAENRYAGELADQWTHYAQTTPGIRNPTAYAATGIATGQPPPEETSHGANLTSRNNDPATLKRYVRAVAWQYEPTSLIEDLTERGATEEQIAELSAIAEQVREAGRAATRADGDADSERESAEDGGKPDAGG